MLGSIDVLRGGIEVETGHARQRAVLAVLLVSVNQAVAVDRLVERVWGASPPAAARSILYGYVSRLRQALADVDAPGGASILARRSGGYVIEADPDLVDMHRFRRLAAAARAAGDDDETATAMFRAALALWRGTPFGDGKSAWLQAIRKGLETERVNALIECHEAELRLGRHAELLDELDALAQAQPLNEVAARSRILALYRSGRQADALTAFRDLRRDLSDAIGVDPSPESHDLHLRILRSDPSLTATQAPGRHVLLSTPAQLPADVPAFIGRDKELAQLDALVRRDSGGTPATAAVGVGVVEGGVGIGKTALAVHWAHKARDRFPDGQLYLQLRGSERDKPPVSPGKALGFLLWSLGVESTAMPETDDERAALYRSLVRHKRMLILLDDAVSAEQVRPLIPGNGPSVLLVTSRCPLLALMAHHRVHRVVVPPFEPRESLQMIAEIAGVPAEADRRTAERLADQCGHVALSLRQAAARLAARPHLSLALLVAEYVAGQGNP